MLPLGPWYLGIQLLPLHLSFPVQWLQLLLRSALYRGVNPEPFKDTGEPIENLFLTVLVEAMLFGPPMWVSRSYIKNSLKIPISLSLWIPSSTLNQSSLGISSLLTVGQILVHASGNQTKKKLLQPFLTPGGAILNAESLLSEPTSINSMWSNYIFLPLLSHILSIHSYAC